MLNMTGQLFDENNCITQTEAKKRAFVCPNCGEIRESKAVKNYKDYNHIFKKY